MRTHMSQTTVTDNDVESLQEAVEILEECVSDTEDEAYDALVAIRSVVSNLESQQDEYTPNLETYRGYRERVEVHADSVEETIEWMVENEERPDVNEAIHQTIDGSRVGTMTHESLAALKLSDSRPEQWSIYVDLENDPSWSEVINAMAFTILQKDVREEYQRRHEDEEDMIA